MTRLTTLNLPDFYKTTIGFDSMFDEMQNAFATNTGGYPPYNIVKESDTSYSISLAVAGFNKDEIKIEQDGNTLSINAEKKPIEEEIEYLHKGIAGRRFARTFNLAEHVYVNSADVDNGILSIKLVRDVPEELKPRIIPVNFK